MKTTVNEMQFVDGFTDCGRESQFSREARRAIFEYLEELENDCGIEMEYDPIAICCEYSEYDSAAACIDDCGYNCDLSNCDDDDEREEAAREYLEEHTTVIEFNSGIVVLDF